MTGASVELHRLGDLGLGQVPALGQRPGRRVAGRELDSGDVAVMMVEAGGTEKSFYYYEDGAPKVDEAVLADGLEACKVWIKESIALQRQLVASVIAVVAASPR